MRRNSGFVFKYFTVALAASALCMQAHAQQVVKKIQPSQLVTNGESFFEASNITTELTRLARRDGFIGATESFKTISKSGQPLATIINQYTSCNPKPTYLISDGGGIDLMSSSDIQGLSTKLKKYLEEMKKGGTKKLLWMIYPDPQAPLGSAQLKSGQDLWAKAVPSIINGCTDPKTLLIDLRTVWAGKYGEYTSDGIHCTNAGGTATAEAFWKMMIDSNFFDLEPPIAVNPYTISSATPSAILSQAVGNGAMMVSLSMARPSNIILNLTTISGRSVLTAQQSAAGGLQSVAFPLGALARGMYCSEVKAGQLTSRSTVLVP